MLKKIENLPPDILGVEAEGKVAREDYETVFMPLLEDAHRRGQKVRHLYHFGPEFSDFTLGAAADDLKVGLKYFRLFAACAIVTDSEWIRKASGLAASIMPVPVRSFGNEQMKAAVEWLGAPEEKSSLKFELRDDSVVVVRPQAALRVEDFDKLAAAVDPWIENHGPLRGVVISVRKFPGWENVGAFIHHMSFVNSHHRKVRRVALAVDGALPNLMTQLADHFVEAEIRAFTFEQEEQAIKWASA